MAEISKTERVNTLVIGGGQAGLSVGYHLQRAGVPFVILDASARVGEAWRKRWDSLRIFTPAKFAGLDGMRFPADPNSFPTKDQMADYLETYAERFSLPVRLGTRVERLSRLGDRFVAVAGNQRFEAENVVIAMAQYQRPRTPSFAAEIGSRVVQLHSFDYKNPSQYQPGSVLVVGAGNSGGEIALEAARHGHQAWMAGPDVGHIPFNIEGLVARLFLARFMLRVVFHRVLTIATPLGRKVRQKMRHKAGPWVRLKPEVLLTAGVQRVPRVVGTNDGRPLLEDGRVLDAANIVWCTGFDAGFSWIDLPVFDANGTPRHEAGTVPSEPGLFFVGQRFLYAASSEMIHGVGRDAARIVRAIGARVAAKNKERISERSEVDYAHAV